MNSSRDKMLTQALAVLRNVRQRPEMYFSPLSPETVEHWLHGFQTGLGVANLPWSPESLTSACERRGVTLYTTTNLIAELKKQGKSEDEVVLTLIDIAEEMWESLLSRGAEPPDAMDSR
jgi:hypothetical protein